MAHGASIRLSTMDLSILSKNKVSLVTLDEKYLPIAIVLPIEGHSRQSKLMHAQVDFAAHNNISSNNILTTLGDKDRIYKFEKIFTKRWIYTYCT